MVITNVEKSDLVEIYNMINDVITEDNILLDIDYFKNHNSIDVLIKDYNDYDYLKAVNDEGKIVGFISGIYNDNVLLISSIAVRNSLRNKGIGRKLLFALEHLYPNAKIEICSPSDIPKNTAFYESMGYYIKKEEKSSNGNKIIYFEKIRD